jgi:hypothetical protein
MKHFLSKDLYLSSYLHRSNCALESYNRINGVTIFSFARTPELERLVESYFSSDPSVNPIKYDRAMSTLRTLAMGPKPRYESTLSSRMAV